MKTSEKIRLITDILNNLPNAFDKYYWSMADTTYKEEIFLAFIISTKTDKIEALKIQSKVLPKNKLVRSILKETVRECMGTYTENTSNVSFYDYL